MEESSTILIGVLTLLGVLTFLTIKTMEVEVDLTDK